MKRILQCVTIAAGIGAMAFGAVSALTHAQLTHPFAMTLWLAGAAAAHDGLVAPVVFAVALFGVRRVPARWRPAVQAGAILTGVAGLVALPFVLGLGRRPDDPSALPLPYGRNLVVVLAAVWTVLLGTTALRARRRPRPADRR